jgi:hypothetical protein
VPASSASCNTVMPSGLERRVSRMSFCLGPITHRKPNNSP